MNKLFFDTSVKNRFIGSRLTLKIGISITLGLHGLANAAILDIPSGMQTKSNLLLAKPFTARMVLFEEFGTKPLTTAVDDSRTLLPPPLKDDGTTDCYGNNIDPAKSGDKLDALIKKDKLYPAPGKSAHTEKDADDNYVYVNPWQQQIRDCGEVDLTLSLPMDGRPGITTDSSGNLIDPFGHQRWDQVTALGLEFQPKSFFQSVMAGARVNGGARDHMQLHGYQQPKLISGLRDTGKWSEFGPSGLYHNTVFSPYHPGAPKNAVTGKNLFDNLTATEKTKELAAGIYASGFNGTTKGIPVMIHPDHTAQDRKSVWTFDGTIPPKLLMARYGEPLLFRHHNALPITMDRDLSNAGFGTHTISTHEHNGHNPAESDGFVGAFFFPGQFYDYRWPLVLAGHDSINKNANDKRAGTPCEPGESVNGRTCPASGVLQIPGDYRETMSTHWFHDHMLDFTAQNVYKGNAAMMNYYSAIDRGNETINDGVNLRLPSGNSKSWGNRDYDVNLVVADKAFDQNGQLYFDPLYVDGFLGDVMTVNWVYKPYMDVRARRYRFRILNGSVSRYMKIAVVAESATGAAVEVPFHMIANDGNIMEHAVAFGGPTKIGTTSWTAASANGVATTAGTGLPPQSIAERYDIVVDFAPLYEAGYRRVYLVNLMEHATGIGPKAPVTLAQAWSAFVPGTKTGYTGNDFAIGKFMEFRLRPCGVDMGVNAYDSTRAATTGQCKDPSMKPAEFTVKKYDTVAKKAVAGGVMLPLPTFTTAELTNAKHRTFDYGRKGTETIDGAPWTIATDGGAGQNAAIDLISAAPTKESVEIWHFKTGGGWAHPAHIHFEEGQIIKRNGVAPQLWEKYARKDMYRIGPEANSGLSMDVAIRVRDFTGTFVQHCHNTQHEDHAMLLRWDSENADHASWVPTPYPEWYGVSYNIDPAGHGAWTHKLTTADTGSKATSDASGFKLPVNWGLKAADVPVTSAPAP